MHVCETVVQRCRGDSHHVGLTCVNLKEIEIINKTQEEKGRHPLVHGLKRSKAKSAILEMGQTRQKSEIRGQIYFF